jgi:hypothetical protein
MENSNPRHGSGSIREPRTHVNPQYRICWFGIFATSNGSEQLRCGSVHICSTGFSFHLFSATKKCSKLLLSGFGYESEPGPVYPRNTGFSPDFGTGSGRGMKTKPGSGEIPRSLVGFISNYDSIPQNDKNNLILLIFDSKILELFQGSVLNRNFNFFRNNTTIRRATPYTTCFKEHINHTFCYV